MYNDNANLPVYECTKYRYNALNIAKILLSLKLPESKIATTRPVCVQDNVAFIVDLSKLDNERDIRADGLGSWHCNGKRVIKCAVDNKSKSH